MKKEEGKAFDLNTEETTQKVLEVGTSTNETKIDDKTSFENFKVLYDGRIKEKCLADYGTTEDKDLLEDTAKELYLASQELIPDEDTKSEGDLEEEKTKQEESVKLTERVSKELVDKMDKNEFTDLYYFSEHIDDIEKVIDNCTDKSKIKQYKEILKAARAFKSGRTKTESKSGIELKTTAGVVEDIKEEINEKCSDLVSAESVQIDDAVGLKLTRKGNQDLVTLFDMIKKVLEANKIKRQDYEIDMKGNDLVLAIRNMTLNESKENDNEYNYMLLSRLKSDCEYFLGNGNRYEKHLWAGNVDDQIAKMKELYNKLPEKPEWLTMEDIENYEKEMKQDKKTESKFDKSQAVLSLDNYHSMGIIVSDDGSTVQYMYSNDEDSVYESDIEYDEEGRPYFKDEEGETWYIDEFMKTTFSESKEIKEEARDRVAENLPKFVYNLTKSDFDKYGETAWSANGPMKNANGKTIYEVYRNGKSDFKIADVVAEIQKEFPELKLSLQSTAPGDRVFFVKETKKQESQSTEVGYNEFTEDMEEIERTINFIKEPKNKDAKEVLDDVKEFLNKLWADKEQNTFGIKYAESKELTEEVEEPKSNKIDDIVAQLMEELPDFAQGYRDIIMELGLSKEDFIDMITTENEHQLLKDKNITEDEEKEVYGKIYDTLV